MSLFLNDAREGPPRGQSGGRALLEKDLLHAPVLGLDRPIRIGEQLPGKSDEVRLSLGQNLLAVVGITQRVAREQDAERAGLTTDAHRTDDANCAAPEIRASLKSVQWFGYDKLLNTPEGQKLPEEISTDPDRLTAWSDPRLKEFMDAYRTTWPSFWAAADVSLARA